MMIGYVKEQVRKPVFKVYSCFIMINGHIITKKRHFEPFPICIG